MPNEQIGAYHLGANPKIYEIQRNNTFEFIVTDIDGIQKAGTVVTESNAYINNAQEMLRISLTSAPIPHYTQEPVLIKRGNSTIKYAGVPTFDGGTITFNDYIGAQIKDILVAWQNLSYNTTTEKVGSLDVTNYKKDCYLIEYTPDFRPIRTWKLYGCWVSGISEDPYSSEDGGKHSVSCTIQYDYGKIDYTGTI